MAAAADSKCLFGDDTAFLFLDFQVGSLALTPDGQPKTQVLNSTAAWLGDVRGIQHGNVTKPEPRLPLIIHSQIIFTKGYPEISPNNRLVFGITSVLDLQAGAPGDAFVPTLTPNTAGGEIVVKKTRTNSALFNTLVQSLQSQNVKKVVLSGIQTTLAITSTAIYLSDMDFVVYVIEDNVLDPGDLDPTNPNQFVKVYNGTTLTQSTLRVNLADYVTPITLADAKSGLCSS
ncbi:hypothetical protein FRB98_002475 [Tulasnella sp. 332]|nr:hypothetical protein FRB98_002475 [Tulasnella sp. 332]